MSKTLFLSLLVAAEVFRKNGPPMMNFGKKLGTVKFDSKTNANTQANRGYTDKEISAENAWFNVDYGN